MTMEYVVPRLVNGEVEIEIDEEDVKEIPQIKRVAGMLNNFGPTNVPEC